MRTLFAALALVGCGASDADFVAVPTDDAYLPGSDAVTEGGADAPAADAPGNETAPGPDAAPDTSLADSAPTADTSPAADAATCSACPATTLCVTSPALGPHCSCKPVLGPLCVDGKGEYARKWDCAADEKPTHPGAMPLTPPADAGGDVSRWCVPSTG